jgi:hypothetical protein
MKPSLFCGRIRPERPLAVNLSPQYAWTHTGIKLLLPNLPCCSKGKTSVDGSRSLFLACKADAVEPSPVVTTCNRKARGLSGTDVRFTPKTTEVVRCREMKAKGHVWTAPAMQGESDFQRSVRVQPCIRPFSAAVWLLALM